MEDTLIYIGNRMMNDNKLNYTYHSVNQNRNVYFIKCLQKINIIGFRIKGEWDNTSFGKQEPNGYLSKGEDLYPKILEWSIADRLAKSNKEALRPPKSAEDLDFHINAIKKLITWESSVNRLRLARYVFEKLIR